MTRTTNYWRQWFYKYLQSLSSRALSSITSNFTTQSKSCSRQDKISEKANRFLNFAFHVTVKSVYKKLCSVWTANNHCKIIIQNTNKICSNRLQTYKRNYRRIRILATYIHKWQTVSASRNSIWYLWILHKQIDAIQKICSFNERPLFEQHN